MNKRKISTFFQNSEGNMLILFACFFVVLTFFLGLSLDIGMIYMKRGEMQNLCQIIREDRFTYQDSVRYADNPGQACYELVCGTASQNGFAGEVKVYFQEEPPAYNYRHYRVRTELIDWYSFTFGRLLGIDETELHVTLDSGESYGEGSTDVIWYPPASASSYNGSYTSRDDGSFVYDSADFPADWSGI